LNGEFDLIARHFAPLAGPEGLGLLDDAAQLAPPLGHDLILTTDANVQGVHFLTDESPDFVARRLLRTNLSDLAAKGARPLGYLLTLALPPEADEAWIAGFAAGLAADQAVYDVALFGGDTVSTSGPLVASIAAVGVAPAGRMLRRSGAKDGDALYVTGTVGDGGFGLDVAQGRLAGLSAAHAAYLESRYRLPEPRVAFGLKLGRSGVATAAADVSDGLVADAGHIAKASGLAAAIEARATPLSAAAAAVLAAAPERLADAMSAGDDYEIVFTAPPEATGVVRALAAETGLPVARIGRVHAGPAGQVAVIGRDGEPLQLGRLGYAHR